MRKGYKNLFNWGLLVLLIIGLMGFFYFRLFEFLTFATLKKHHALLISWTNQHYFFAVLIFILIYILVVAFSIPGGLLLTLTGGLLFGPVAVLYVMLAATMGSTILFFAVRNTLGAWLELRARGWVTKLEKGFQESAFNYLLILRLVPLFPFWMVNIVAGLLDVKAKDFIVATLLGIIPATIIYVLVGNSLNTVFQTDKTPQFNIIFTPPILLPLLGLAFLAILPVIYKKIELKNKQKKQKRNINAKSH